MQLLMLPTSDPKLGFKIAVQSVFPNARAEDFVSTRSRFSGQGYSSGFQACSGLVLHSFELNAYLCEPQNT